MIEFKKYYKIQANDLSLYFIKKFKDEDKIDLFHYKNIIKKKDLWESGDQRDRSWLFHLHNFSILDAFIAHELWNDVFDLIHSWAEKYSKIVTVGAFPWHDHATALRLEKLSIVKTLSGRNDFDDLAQLHADLLSEDRLYSKGSNHGFDQAKALLLAAKTYNHLPNSDTWRAIALERLTYEINFAFNPEGVHVENSPGYHIGMTNNLLKARAVLKFVDAKLDFNFDPLLANSLRFIAWIITPSARASMLGDTGSKAIEIHEALSDIATYKHALYAMTAARAGAPLKAKSTVYKHAGYAIYRSNWSAENWAEHTHIVMKSGYLANYHRQDDDLNILLHAHGEAWLIDSGLYNHKEDDPVRIYMRSAMAHNVPLLTNLTPSRQVPMGDQASKIRKLRRKGCEAAFKGETHIWPNTMLTRTLVIYDANNFLLTDTLNDIPEGSELYILFHVPSAMLVRTDANIAIVQGRSKRLVIHADAEQCTSCHLYSGMQGAFKSMYSDKINEATASQVIVFGPVKTKQIKFRIHFES